MTFTAPHIYLVIAGDAYNGTERWQFGLRLSDGGISGQATADAVASTVSSWWSNANSSFFLSHQLTEVKASRIDVNGKLEGGTTAGLHFFTPKVPGSAAQSNGGDFPQLSLCATLLTAVPRGLGSKGRIFPPPQATGAPGADGLLIAATALQSAQNVASLITSLNAISLVGNVQVMSRGKGVWHNDAKGKKIWAYPGTGYSNNVTSVGVGRVVDTQRRRRRSLVESRQVSAVT